MNASIIIPSYNASERLFYNLISLCEQSCSKEQFEVVVIDNGSTDETWSMLNEFDNSFKLKKIRLKNNRGRAFARNIGILEASGDIIIFCDSDMISSRSFVEEHIKEHCRENIAVCGTSWDKIYTYFYRGFSSCLDKNYKSLSYLYETEIRVNKLPDKACLIDKSSIIDESYKKFVFTYAIQQHGYDKILERYGQELTDYSFPWSFFITNNCSVSRENVVKAGLFDEQYEGWGCEDLDLGYRLYKNGCEFMKKEIKSVHQEHPINKVDDGIKNIYYFSEKYDTSDILLFYFSKLSSINRSSINQIVKEISLLETKNENLQLLELFKNMLKLLRDRTYMKYRDNKNYIKLSKSVREQLIVNRAEILADLQAISFKYDCKNIAAAFEKLAMQLYKIKLNVKLLRGEKL
ncbi:MAG: glycosyltransferase [Lutisporaceae bacterium]